MKNRCYLCGKACEDDLTKDHVPPEGFFPKPRPTNLITAPCCEPCNGSMSLHDEAFRAWVSSTFVSEAGKRIWRERVVGRSFKDSPKLKANMAKAMLTLPLETPEGDILHAPALSIPSDRADIFLNRLTKGLLTHFYPEYNYWTDAFVNNVLPPILTEKQIDYFMTVIYGCIADRRGEGVFDFWRSVEIGVGGIWVYRFYGAAICVVRHSQNVAII